ncbi:MAG: acyltransferase [Sphingomonadales bacterium]|nr:acyltransferase [Sphingomonadales bacterium]
MPRWRAERLKKDSPSTGSGRTESGGDSVRLEQLTALRFFAALAVLASHLWILAETANPLQGLAKGLFAEGFAGVSFFFMLSGYILSHSYGGRLRDGTISREEYWVLRVARIGPLHWLIGLPFAVTAGWAALPVSVVNMAMLQSCVPAEHWYFSLNEPSWSLSDELFFYTCFGWLAFWPLRRVGLLAGALLALATGVAWLRTAQGQGAIHAGDAMTLTHWLTYINPLTRLLDFTAGMLVYRLPRPTLPRGQGTLLEAAALAALLGALALFPALGMAEAWRMQLAYLAPIALLIWSFGLGRGALSRALANAGWLVLLGDASFALYLLHLPVIHGFLALDEAREVAWPVLPLAGAMTVCAVVLSVAVFRWVETPLLKRSRKLIRQAFAHG